MKTEIDLITAWALQSAEAIQIKIGYVERMMTDIGKYPKSSDLWIELIELYNDVHPKTTPFIHEKEILEDIQWSCESSYRYPNLLYLLERIEGIRRREEDEGDLSSYYYRTPSRFYRNIVIGDVLGAGQTLIDELKAVEDYKKELIQAEKQHKEFYEQLQSSQQKEEDKNDN
jgi:hypothetical protein